jgi:hypothetical protein
MSKKENGLWRLSEDGIVELKRADIRVTAKPMAASPYPLGLRPSGYARSNR